MSTPREVKIACNLMWAGYLLLLLEQFLIYPFLLSPREMKFFEHTPPLTFALAGILLAWMTVKIFKGRNWARILLLIWIALGAILLLVGVLLPPLRQVIVSPPVILPLIIHVGIGGVVTYLLFLTEAKTWFKRQSQQEGGRAPETPSPTS